MTPLFLPEEDIGFDLPSEVGKPQSKLVAAGGWLNPKSKAGAGSCLAFPKLVDAKSRNECLLCFGTITDWLTG